VRRLLNAPDDTSYNLPVNPLRPGVRFIHRLLPLVDCSVCGQAVDSRTVYVGDLPSFLKRLDEERFALCPSCSQEVPEEVRQEEAYRARWWQLSKKMIGTLRKGRTSFALVPRD
jgi:hypothetical protein